MVAVPDSVSTLELSRLWIQKALERIAAENTPEPTSETTPDTSETSSSDTSEDAV